MPFARPTLTELRTAVAADISAGLPGVDTLLRYSNLGVAGDALAALASGLYGYADYIAKQSVPFTATGEYLEGWAALKEITRKPATAATGYVLFAGTSGLIPAGAAVTRSDGAIFTVIADAPIVSNFATAQVVATVPGSGGNTAQGTTLTLSQSISGITPAGTVSTVIAGGADVELDDDLRTRMIQAYSNPAQGGSSPDYVRWALEVPGVTRAWPSPSAYGAGTIGVLFMMDDAESANSGFPQGTNGVATNELRAAAATGDQLTVANSIFIVAPVTAMVYAVAPIPNTVALTIGGILGASTGTKAAILTAFVGALQQSAIPGGVTPISAIETAIGAVSGAVGFVITLVTASAGTVSPGSAGNITSNAGALPTPGAISYTS